MEKKDIRNYKRDYLAAIKYLKNIDMDETNKDNIIEYANYRITQAGLRRTTTEIQQLQRLADFFKINLIELNNEVKKGKVHPVTLYQKAFKLGEIKKRKPKPIYSKQDGKTIRTGTDFIESNTPIKNTFYEWNKTLKKLLKWKLDIENHQFIKTIRDLPTKPPEEEEARIISISDKKIREYIQLVESFDLKVICGALYNTGLRPQELFQLRFNDGFNIVKRDNGTKKITFKLDYTKTKKRTVSIFIKEDVEIFLTYLREKHPNRKTNDYVFPQNVYWMGKLLKKTTKKYLGFGYRLKDFRSSHATNFSSKVPEALLNTNMGWRQGSRTKARYIDSNEHTNEDYLEAIEERVDVKERKKLENENHKLKKDVDTLKEKLNKTVNGLDSIKEFLSVIIEKNPELANQKINL